MRLYIPKHSFRGLTSEISPCKSVMYTGRRPQSPERVGCVHFMQEMKASHPYSQIEFDRPLTRSKTREERSKHPWQFSHDDKVVNEAKQQKIPFWRQASGPIDSIHFDPSASALLADGTKSVIWMDRSHKSQGSRCLSPKSNLIQTKL